jgi:hypothetical protein
MRILLVSLLFVSLPALADPAPTTKQMHADDCAKARAAKRDCVIDMSGEQVDGNTPSANGIVSTALKFPKNGSLIHIRREFIEQMLKTAEDL